MQQKVELNKIRNFGETIDDSILFFKQNWKLLLKAYFIICGFFWATGLVVSVISQIQTLQHKLDGSSIFTLTYFASLVFAILNYTVITLTTLSFITLYQRKENEAPTIEEIWGYVKFYFFRIFGSFFLLIIGLIIGFVCCILPGIYLWPVFSLIITIMVMENTSLGYAFNRAFHLIKDNWWHTFGILMMISLLIIISMLLIIIPAEIIGGLLVFLTGAKGTSTYMLSATIAMHLVQFLQILPVIAVALVYFTLTEQKEDLTLLDRIQMLGKHNPETDQPTAEEEY